MITATQTKTRPATKTIQRTETFQLPQFLLNYWRTREVAEKKITEASVLNLVAKDKITASRGAEVLGMSLWDFYDLMYENGVTLGDATPKEMEEGVKTLHALLDKNKSKKVKMKK